MARALPVSTATAATTCAAARRRAQCGYAVAVVRIGRGVDTGNALAISHKIEECRPAGRSYCRVRVVKEAAGCAVEENEVVLFQVSRVDVGRIVGDRR